MPCQTLLARVGDLPTGFGKHLEELWTYIVAILSRYEAVIRGDSDAHCFSMHSCSFPPPGGRSDDREVVVARSIADVNELASE